MLVLGFCVAGWAYVPNAHATLVGNIQYFQVLMVFAIVLGSGPLLRAVGSPHLRQRTITRIILAYLLYELLLVFPVALWLDTTDAETIIAEMGIRVAWLLFPVVLTICEDPRARRLAGAAAVVAAVCLVAWGAYATLSGAGMWYVNDGELRYRALGPGAFVLIAWPYVVAVAGVASRRLTPLLLAIAIAGVALTNQRSAFLALAVAGIACLVMSGQTRRILVAVVPIALVAAVGYTLWWRQLNGALGYTFSHLADTDSVNALDRLARWGFAAEYFVSRPFNDWVWSWRFYPASAGVVWELGAGSHNLLLEVTGTEGLAGLAFYGSVLWTALRGTWRWGRRDAETRALLGWLIAYLAYSTLNANHYAPASLPLFVAALAALVSRLDWLNASTGQLEAAQIDSLPPRAAVVPVGQPGREW